jgi:signal transduction histidine kinase
MRQPRAIPSEQFRALTERIERMREAERTRIARELHDELGQLLTGIKLDFSATVRRIRELRPNAPASPDSHAVQGEVLDRLQSALGQIDIAIAMVRRISTDLRPAALDHHDLASAIMDEARRVSARAGLPIRLACRLEKEIDGKLATAAFRIFQEALTNAVRHARATAISARVSARHGQLLLFVRDNGVGLPDIPTSGHLGILGMHERARSVAGRLEVRSRRGRGTLVACVLPLDD